MKRKFNSISVEKASGDSQNFSQQKLYRSLRKAGASKDLADRILIILQDQIYSGMPTHKLFRKAYQLLYKEARSLAARYSLKKAIMQLGPSGYPFEKMIAAIFAQQGYKTRVGQTLKGNCVNHEVDVVAQKNNHRLMVECKFRNDSGKKSDVKVTLYVYARWLDLKKNKDHSSFNEFWLATNTKFTKDAIRYGNCVGLKLLGWDHPKGKSLKDLIQLAQIHPITCLTSLKSFEKDKLIKQKIILCKEVLQRPELLSRIGFQDSRISRVLEEITALTEPPV